MFQMLEEGLIQPRVSWDPMGKAAQFHNQLALPKLCFQISPISNKADIFAPVFTLLLYFLKLFRT